MTLFRVWTLFQAIFTPRMDAADQPQHVGNLGPTPRRGYMEHLEELEAVYLSLERLESPKKRWSLEDLEKEIDLGG